MSIWQEVRLAWSLLCQALATMLFAMLVLTVEVIITFLVGILFATFLFSL